MIERQEGHRGIQPAGPGKDGRHQPGVRRNLRAEKLALDSRRGSFGSRKTHSIRMGCKAERRNEQDPSMG